jgi:hypothetical protein
MNAFPDELLFSNYRVENDSMIVTIKDNFRYFSKKHGLITVPSGFVSDGASVPRVFWSIFPPFGKYFKAAIIHDYLYSSENNAFNRVKSDYIFLEAMKETNVSFIIRYVIYNAVRIGGGIHFKGQIK